MFAADAVMALNFQQRKRLYNLCNPDEALTPEDPRNIDFDALPQEVRGASWVAALAADIELSGVPVSILVAGLPGSGKSTELHRLEKRLASSNSAGLLPVYIDAETLLDLTSRIDVVDIVTAILYASERAVLVAEQRDPALALTDGYIQRLWHWLTTTDVELGRGNLAIPGGASLSVELKSRPSLRQRVRTVVAGHFTQFLTEARAELKSLDERATLLDHGGLLVIFDSLEKLRGTTSAWHEVLDSAEIFFLKNVPNLDLPVHIVFTVPTALLTRIGGIRLLPMLKVRTREGEPYAPGVAAARELITRRIEPAALKEIFGPEMEARIDEMVRWSGGYPRELIRLLRDAIRDSAAGPLSNEVFARMFAGVVETYRFLVSADVVPWLVSVARTRFMTVERDDQRLAADRMLQNNAILYYANAEGWHDLHPALYENPIIRTALATAERAIKDPKD